VTALLSGLTSACSHGFLVVFVPVVLVAWTIEVVFPTDREVALFGDRCSIDAWLVRAGLSVADAFSRIVVERAVVVVVMAGSLGGTIGELAHG
jgi:hypothetical protein